MTQKKSSKIEPPEQLWRVLIEPGGGYGHYPDYEKFWKLQKFSQYWSDRCNKVYYDTVDTGIAFTTWGLKRSIRKAYKKNEQGYTGKYFPVEKFL